MRDLTIFDSVDEFITTAKNEPSNVGSPRMNESRKSPSQRWDLGVGLDGAFQLAETGWPEGAKKIKEAMDRIEEIAKPKTYRQDCTWKHDGGAFVDVAKFLGGEQECFVEFRPPEEPKKPIKIFVSLAAAFHVSSSTMVRRGAAVGAALDLLEAEGYLVELWGIIDGVSGGGKCTQLIKIKDTDQPLDLDRLAYLMVHPAFFRRIWFAYCDQLDPNSRRSYGFILGEGYGSVISTSSEFLKEIESDLHFESLRSSSEFETEEAAGEEVSGILRGHGFLEQEETV